MKDVDAFIRARRERWLELEKLTKGLFRLTPLEVEELSDGYRSACADLAASRSLDLPPDVALWLEGLVSRAHSRLYGDTVGARGTMARALQIVAAEFPATLRQEWRWFLAASLLFYVPLVVSAGLAWSDESWALVLMSPGQLAQTRDAYSTPIDRSILNDAEMAGFYIFNNVGIAFRCFATGALFGLGSVFFTVFNGLSIGAVFGDLFRSGMGENLVNFTAGHSAWELTAITVAAAAGLRLGAALVDLREASASENLRDAGPVLIRLMAGAAVMLFVAAAIEGFWSGQAMPTPVKVGMGVVQACLVAAWLALGGRRAVPG